MVKNTLIYNFQRVKLSTNYNNISFKHHLMISVVSQSLISQESSFIHTTLSADGIASTSCTGHPKGMSYIDPHIGSSLPKMAKRSCECLHWTSALRACRYAGRVHTVSQQTYYRGISHAEPSTSSKDRMSAVSGGNCLKNGNCEC